MLWNMLMIWKAYRPLQRLFKEEDGMEMVQWAIVATVFAVASAVLWATLSGAISVALHEVEETLDQSSTSSSSDDMSSDDTSSSDASRRPGKPR